MQAASTERAHADPIYAHALTNLTRTLPASASGRYCAVQQREGRLHIWGPYDVEMGIRVAAALISRTAAETGRIDLLGVRLEPWHDDSDLGGTY